MINSSKSMEILKKSSKKKTRKTIVKMKNQSSKMKNRIKIHLEKVLAKFFEKNIFFIAYMNHVLFYNNSKFDKELTREQVNHVKQFFNLKTDMELAPILPIISVIYNKYYIDEKNAEDIKDFFKIFKMDKSLDKFMIFILKPSSDIKEMDGGIPPKTNAMLSILFFTISLLLYTYIINISKNSVVKDLFETGSYIKNIYKNSEQCDIGVTHDNNTELLKRIIDYLGFKNTDTKILGNFLKSIECFNERNFEEYVTDELFNLKDFEPINENNELVPINNNMALVSVVTMSNDNTALVPANYKFDKIVETQIITYVKNGITDPEKIKNLLKEINEKPDKPASEKTFYELAYDIIGKNINQENIAALMTGNINFFVEKYDNLVDKIEDTIAKYNIAAIKAKRMTSKVITKTTRGTRSIIFLIMMLFTWYGYATYCVAKIISNIQNMRNLAIEKSKNLAIEDRGTDRIE